MLIVLWIVLRVLSLAKHAMSLVANSLPCLTERVGLGSWETCALRWCYLGTGLDGMRKRWFL